MAPHTPHRSDAPRRSRGAPRACHTMAHRSSWGAPIWPPTPPIARTRPGAAVARLGLDTGCLIDRRGGAPHWPPPPPPPPPAPPPPRRAPGLAPGGSFISLGGAPPVPPPPPPPPH